MSDEDEWFGEPHTLTVHEVTPPGGPLDDGSLDDYDLEHPPSCKQEESHLGYMAWTCDVGHQEEQSGLAFSLRYSGTPIIKPGTYRIRAWSRKWHVPDYGTCEYDGGVGLMDPEDAP